MKRLLVPAVVLLIAATSASLAWTAGRAAPPPPVIAVVDVSTVLMRLNERTARSAELEAQRDTLQKRINELETKIKAENDVFKVLPEGAERKSKRDQLQRLAWQFEIEGKLSQKTLDELEAEMIRSLYLKISDSAARVAKANGYTMVLSSDESAGVPEQNLGDILRIMGIKRMLYVDPRHDITEELIVFMNNEFGAPPPPPRPPGPPRTTITTAANPARAAPATPHGCSPQGPL